jgi:sRNA-binding carbon storage regulator CsrA
MLVLTRFPEQRVRASWRDESGRLHEIWIVVLEVEGERVRLGFDAERQVTIDREEIVELKSKQAIVV